MISWDLWNVEFLLVIKVGSSHSNTESSLNTQSSLRMDRAPSSETLLAEVMAVRNRTFQVRNFKSMSFSGSNGALVRAKVPCVGPS